MTDRYTATARDPSEMRDSINAYCQRRDRFDITIVHNSEDATTTEHMASSTLLIASSEYFNAIIFGPMGDDSLLDKKRESRIVNVCVGTSNAFGLMVDFINGSVIKCNDDMWEQLYVVAAFYVVSSLVDKCCKYWFENLCASNCCSLLMTSERINCQSVKSRCFYMLIQCLEDVAARDSCYYELSAKTLISVIKSEFTACSNERALLLLLVRWYVHKTDERLDAFEKMLSHVFWNDIIDHRGQMNAETYAEHVERLLVDVREICSSDICPDPKSKKRKNPTDFCHIAKRVALMVPEFANYNATDWPRRNNSHAFLSVNDVKWVNDTRIPFQLWTDDETRHWNLQTRERLLIGRSRKADVRIGHDNEKPYISGKHFIVYSKMEWILEPGADPDKGEVPFVVAYIVDFSENGTFVNGKKLKKGVKSKLKHGDNVHVVFFPQQIDDIEDSFPSFTFSDKDPDVRGVVCV